MSRTVALWSQSWDWLRARSRRQQKWVLKIYPVYNATWWTHTHTHTYLGAMISYVSSHQRKYKSLMVHSSVLSFFYVMVTTTHEYKSKYTSSSAPNFLRAMVSTSPMQKWIIQHVEMWYAKSIMACYSTITTSCIHHNTYQRISTHSIHLNSSIFIC